MFIKSSFELKVGIFIFIGIVILSVIIFSVGNFYSVKRGYSLNIVFNFANGINVGAPVRYAGVEVGEVQDIEVYFDEKENKPLVRLLAWVARDTWINEDAKAAINTLGLLGEKYLEIVPGTRESRLLKKGDTLRGQDPVSTEELARETKVIFAKIEKAIESMDSLLGDEEFRLSIKNTAANLESLSKGMVDFMAQAKDGDGTMGRFMSDARLYEHIDELVLDIKAHPWKLLYRPKESRVKK